jgi:SAM-dependent methyltransferase
VSRSQSPDVEGAAAPTLDPGSFRDWDSRVFYDDGRIRRALSEDGLADWRAFAGSRLFAEAVAEGKLVETSELEGAQVPAGLVRDAAGVLEHERIPFVSYPYEWPFSMLKDAALLQLELLRRALDEDLILKDATPYNVQFRGAQPVFIDIGSFERLPAGEPWAAYRQFCMLFLYPLLLQAYKGVPFQPWLRGSLAGIQPAELRALMSFRDLFRRGVLTNVALLARFERKGAAKGGEVKAEMKKAGFRKDFIVANVKRLEKTIRHLEWKAGQTEWSDYGMTTSYSDSDAVRKEGFVREVVMERPRDLAWDLGCNEGRHARIAAENTRYVVAVDGDAAVADRLYRTLAEEGATSILPLTGDLTDPSPALGWGGLERSPLDARGTPDLVLCLAVIHHVALSGNVPVPAFLDWLRSLGAELVIEFPTRDDPRVAAILSRKREGADPGYDLDVFERELGDRYEIARREELAGGTRILFHARPR